MSDVPAYQRPGDEILHQEATEGVIEDVIEGGVGANSAAIADAETDHTVNATFSNTEVKGHLDALGTTLNLVLAHLRATDQIDAT